MSADEGVYKIGIDCRMFSDAFTGIGRYNYELTKRLFKKREYKNKPLKWVIFMNHPEYEKYNFPSHVKKVLVEARHYTFAEQWYFLRLLNREDCDLVHFTHFNLPLLYRKPFVVTIHDATISFFPGKKMNTWWRKSAYNLVFGHAVTSSKAIIAVSHNTRNDVVRLFPQSEEKINVVWNGIGTEFQKPSAEVRKKIRSVYKLSGDFLLYTGVWREHKNLVGLIKAFGKISQKYPDLKLVITGKEDPYYPEVKQETERLGLSDRVRFVGLVPFEDLVALYGEAKIFVFPSFYEGFGFPPLEAMLIGTPVCASKAASIPEICGEAALYFDPYDVDDMAQKLGRLLEDSSLRRELVRVGRKQVRKFSWDKCSEAVFEIYETVLGGGRKMR